MFYKLAAELQVKLPDDLTGTPKTIDGFIPKITQLLLWIVGITAVIVIIIAGLMYITSSGDPARTKAAKDAIVAAIIGLIIAILAYAIVTFVIVQFK